MSWGHWAQEVEERRADKAEQRVADLEAGIRKLADEFARSEAETHEFRDSYAEGQRDAYDYAEQLTALVGDEQTIGTPDGQPDGLAANSSRTPGTGEHA